MKSNEESRLRLQYLLDGQKTQRERNIMGQFATPSKLACDVLAYAKSLFPINAKIRFLDPAFGTGSFYSALISQFSEDQIFSAHGIEVDAHYASPTIDFWKGHPIEITVGDFLALAPPQRTERANLLICNPPYVRHHHLNGTTKSQLAQRVAETAGLTMSGLAGLYCYFIAVAHTWLAEDGIAAWLIPSEFMDVNYGSVIRKYLTEAVELLHIHRFDPANRQFEDALVSSTVVWFRNRKPTNDLFVKMSYGGTLAEPVTERQTPVDELRKSRKWSALAQGERKRESDQYRLSDLFRIKRGLATGDNKFFVLSERKAVELEIPVKFLKPILPSPRNLKTDIILGDSDGLPLLPSRSYLLDCDLNEEELLKLNSPLSSYLASGREKALKTYICSRRTPWYSQEVRPPAPLICTYMGRSLDKKTRPFRFIMNESRATALNVYLLLYPTPVLKNALDRDPELLRRIWQMLSEVPAIALLSEGRVYGGGLYKMEPRELANLPADQFMALLPKRDDEFYVQRQLFANSLT